MSSPYERRIATSDTDALEKRNIPVQLLNGLRATRSKLAILERAEQIMLGSDTKCILIKNQGLLRVQVMLPEDAADRDFMTENFPTFKKQINSLSKNNKKNCYWVQAIRWITPAPERYRLTELSEIFSCMKWTFAADIYLTHDRVTRYWQTLAKHPWDDEGELCRLQRRVMELESKCVHLQNLLESRESHNDELRKAFECEKESIYRAFLRR